MRKQTKKAEKRWDFLILISVKLYEYITFWISQLRPPKWYFILYFFSEIVLFYFLDSIVYPFFKKGQSLKLKVLGSVLFICSILSFIFLYAIFDSLTTGNFKEIELELTKNQFLIYAWRGLFISQLSALYFFIIKSSQEQKTTQDLRISNLELARENFESSNALLKVKNDFLKSQANTHLLFNTLNFLYNDAFQVNEKLAGTIMSLSEYMQYSLLEVEENGKVRLEEELLQVERYIHLNLERFPKPVFFNLNKSVEDGCKELMILPLILTPFIENVFKYANFKDEANPVLLSIHCDQGLLKLQIRNKKKQFYKPHSHGIGIKNVRERLAQHYAVSAYSISIEETDDLYSLTFNLQL